MVLISTLYGRIISLITSNIANYWQDTGRCCAEIANHFILNTRRPEGSLGTGCEVATKLQSDIRRKSETPKTVLALQVTWLAALINSAKAKHYVIVIVKDIALGRIAPS